MAVHAALGDRHEDFLPAARSRHRPRTRAGLNIIASMARSARVREVVMLVMLEVSEHMNELRCQVQHPVQAATSWHVSGVHRGRATGGNEEWIRALLIPPFFCNGAISLQDSGRYCSPRMFSRTRRKALACEGCSITDGQRIDAGCVHGLFPRKWVGQAK